jgi:hypothetical protein
MERRAFLKFMIAGAGAAAAVAASGEALALTSVPAVVPPAEGPEPAVATPADLEQAKVEKAQWGYRRRYYWRPRRRVWGRPVYWRARRWPRRYYRYY